MIEWWVWAYFAFCLVALVFAIWLWRQINKVGK